MPGLRPGWFAVAVLLLGGLPAQAQLAVEPESIGATVPQHETTTRTVTLSNTGGEPLTFCVSFDRPLQRTAGKARLAEGAAGGEPCGPYGEVLYRYDEGDFGAGWDPSAITMTPEGRLFVAESAGFPWRTFEFTPDLQLLHSFEHPHLAELTPFSGTPGVAYDPESGTLWWMNAERTSVNGQVVTRRVLLLEGDLDGVATGRRIELAPPDAPIEAFNPAGLAFDGATGLFYLRGILGPRSDHANWELWAFDRAGAVPEGYPLRPEPYPSPAIIGPPDVHGGAEGRASGVRVEYGAYPPGAPGYDRNNTFFQEDWDEIRASGFLTVLVPEEFGGAGLDVQDRHGPGTAARRCRTGRAAHAMTTTWTNRILAIIPTAKSAA